MTDLFDTPATILSQHADPEAVDSFLAYRKKHKRESITPNVLRALINYCPDTGMMTWRERPRLMFKSDRSMKIWNSKYSGAPALACFDASNGYLKGCVLYVKMYAHRAAFMIHYGVKPSGLIDHINGDRTDNRVLNIRDVSYVENARNVRPSGKSGHVGVYWHDDCHKWQARTCVRGRTFSGGYFSRIEDAVAARRKLEEEKWD